MNTKYDRKLNIKTTRKTQSFYDTNLHEIKIEKIKLFSIDFSNCKSFLLALCAKRLFLYLLKWNIFFSNRFNDENCFALCKGQVRLKGFCDIYSVILFVFICYNWIFLWRNPFHLIDFVILSLWHFDSIRFDYFLLFHFVFFFSPLFACICLSFRNERKISTFFMPEVDSFLIVNICHRIECWNRFTARRK